MGDWCHGQSPIVFFVSYGAVAYDADMEITTVNIGRISVHLGVLTPEQIANVFGVASEVGIVRPTVPDGTTQEDAYLGSVEYKAEFDAFVREQNRVEFIGLVAHARDPILWELNYQDGDAPYEDYKSQSLVITDFSNRWGFVHDERYPNWMIEGERIVFIAEKTFKLFPDGSNKIAEYVNDALRRVGFIGGDAISAEIKSEESNVSGDTVAGTGVDGAGEAQDPVRETHEAA